MIGSTFLAITMQVNKSLEGPEKFDFEHIVNPKELTTKMGFKGYHVNLFLDKEGMLKIINRNISFELNENGNLEVSEGKDFIEILETLI